MSKAIDASQERLQLEAIGYRELHCEECIWLNKEEGNICRNRASENYGMTAGWPYIRACDYCELPDEPDGEDKDPSAPPQDDTGALALIPEAAAQLHTDVQQISGILLQMGTLISNMQRRMDEMEARQARVTVNHGDVKRIQAMIRVRADEICQKYQLTDVESVKRFRAAIKKDVLKRWGVKDLHDIPEAALAGMDEKIGSWVNIRLVMERRAGSTGGQDRRKSE